MLDEKEINEIIEMREKGLKIRQIAKAVGRSESTIKKYISDDYENNELDEKAGKTLTDQMKEERYDFDDEIKPLVYSLKIQANEIDITLHDYLTDISKTMNKFLRITNTPQWFYYVFCELANNYSLITDHIDAEKLMEAIDNFYNREIEMENAEAFIIDIETKAEKIVSETKAKLEDLNSQNNEAQKELDRLASIQTTMLKKLMDDPNREKLKKSEKNLKNMENEAKRLEMVNAILTEKCKLLEQPDEYNEQIKKKIMLYEKVFERVNKIMPDGIMAIVQEIENENK